MVLAVSTGPVPRESAMTEPAKTERNRTGLADERLVNLIRQYADANQIECDRTDEASLVLVLPGQHKLKTAVLLVIGRQSVTINAFVIRQPDENHAAFYRWLLERNRRMYCVAFALDRLGDVYLVGKSPKASLDSDELDRILGSVLEAADGAFDSLLELGFAEAIRREWRWRISRGESTRNLDAFRHLVADSDPPLRQDGDS